MPDDPSTWAGRTVTDRHGERIGELEEVYYGAHTRAPEWIVVASAFVPLAGARIDRDEIRLAYEKAEVVAAPKLGADRGLSAQLEAAIYRHYGLRDLEARVRSREPEREAGGEREPSRASAARKGDGSRAPSGSPESKPFYLTSEFLVFVVTAVALAVAAVAAGVFGAPSAWLLVAAVAAAYIVSRGTTKSGTARTAGTGADEARATPTPKRTDAGETMTVSEERLYLDKQARPRERVRVTKDVVVEEVTVTVPVRREELRIERVPVADDEPLSASVELGAPAPGYEITLMHEVPVVDKRVVPRERVRLEKDVVTDQQQISAELRREEVDVQREPAPPAENP